MNRETLVRLLADRVTLGILSIEQVPLIYAEDVSALLPVVEEEVEDVND